MRLCDSFHDAGKLSMIGKAQVLARHFNQHEHLRAGSVPHTLLMPHLKLVSARLCRPLPLEQYFRGFLATIRTLDIALRRWRIYALDNFQDTKSNGAPKALPFTMPLPHSS